MIDWDKILKKRQKAKEKMIMTTYRFGDKNKRYVLIGTDGYSIKVIEVSRDKKALIENLRQIYKVHIPDNWSDELKEQSCCTDTNAILYDGSNVYVWNIIVVNFD